MFALLSVEQSKQFLKTCLVYPRAKQGYWETVAEFVLVKRHTTDVTDVKYAVA